MQGVVVSDYCGYWGQRARFARQGFEACIAPPQFPLAHRRPFGRPVTSACGWSRTTAMPAMMRLTQPTTQLRPRAIRNFGVRAAPLFVAGGRGFNSRMDGGLH